MEQYYVVGWRVVDDADEGGSVLGRGIIIDCRVSRTIRTAKVGHS